MFSTLGKLVTAAVLGDRTSPLGWRAKVASGERAALENVYFDSFMASAYPDKYAAAAPLAELTALGTELGKALLATVKQAANGEIQRG